MDNQTLELKLKSKSEEMLSAFNKLLTSLDSVDKKLGKVNGKLNSGKTDNVRKQADNLAKSVDKATNSANKLKKALSLSGATVVLDKIAGGFRKSLEESIDYSENLNLFNVALDDLTDKGMKFQNALNEAFGANQSKSLYFQGIFQAMTKSMGVANDYAYTLSEGLIKVGYDLASLYNISDESAMQKLRAGLAGQTEPLRTVGMDITENSLKPLIEKLNLTDSTGELLTPRQMNYAEKMLLRYLAIVDQAKVAQGDFANTIEAPANQLKILSMQAIEAKRALGNLFVGAFSRILPYANAILMVIKEVANAIASFFGIKISDYNSSIAEIDTGFSDVGDTVDDVGSGLGSATKKAKELKREILGFDQINNITENQDTGSTGGSGSGGATFDGGIDQRLLDALKSYDNGMEKVRMKANQIRDKIMEWLGFTKEIDPITGKVSFKYGGIKKTLSNIWKSFKGLSTEGKVLVGLGLGVGAIKLLNTGKKLITVFGNSGLAKVIKGLYNPTSSLFSSMLIGLKSSHSSLKTGMQSWREQMGIINSTTGKVDGFKGALNGAKVAMQGLITGAVGLYAVSKSMQSLSTDGANLLNVLGLVGGSLTTIASGVQIGAIFGPWGAAIGGATGALTVLITGLLNYENQGEKTAETIKKSIDVTKKYSSSLLEQYNAISETTNKEIALTTAHSDLVDELESIVDANKKVKKGYEERAEFIVSTLNKAYGTELSISDGKIKKMDEEISKIRDVISEKKREIALENASQSYQIALKEKAKSYQNLETAIKDYNDAVANQKKYEQGLKKSWEAYKDSFYKHYGTYEKFLDCSSKRIKGYEKIISTTKEAKDAMNEATTAYDANTTAIMQYQGVLSADAQENAELVDYYMNQIENTYYNGKETIKLTYAQQIKDAQEYHDSVLRSAKASGQEMNDEMNAQAESRLNIVVESLKAQTTEIKDGKFSNDLKEAWKTLSTTNYDVYKAELEKMDPKMKEQIEKVTGVIISKTPEVETVTDEMSKKVIKKMEKSQEAKKKGVELVKGQILGLSDKQQRQLLEDCGVKNVDKVMKGLKKGDLSEDVGLQILKGLNKGLKNDYWQDQSLSTAFTLSNKVLKQFKKVFKIKSPSRETRQIGIYLLEGMTNGISLKQKSVLNLVDNFGNDILEHFEQPFKILPKHLEENMDNFTKKISKADLKFSPGDISLKMLPNIESKYTNSYMTNEQILIDSNLFQEASYQGFSKAIKDFGLVNVEINARTDKGTIVETAVKGINQKTKQTGVCPINMPI